MTLDTIVAEEEKTLMDKLEDKRNKVNKLVDTIEVEHQAAYLAGTEHLRDDDGEVDYKKLKEDDVREEVATKMTEHYVSKAKEYFGIDEDEELDEFQTDRLLDAYAGITKVALKNQLRAHKDKFTVRKFREVVDKAQEEVEENLQPHMYDHIEDTDEHKEEIVKAVGLEGKVSPQHMTRENTINLALTYLASGEEKEDRHVPSAVYKEQPYAVREE